MAASTQNSIIRIAYMNIRGQTGLESAKQVQIEHFLKSYSIDILNIQESNILEETFTNCDLINSSYQIITNNASNKYGTTSLVSNCLQTNNIKNDSQGRVIVFDIGNVTFSNIYLPCGNDSVMKSRSL